MEYIVGSIVPKGCGAYCDFKLYEKRFKKILHLGSTALSGLWSQQGIMILNIKGLSLTHYQQKTG
ncbi:MAG: hypothetical protein U9P70_05000 [Patescibacteria group bacterium]|nr:hypothetical protein [Patescibacteria group bacterium]